MAADIFTVTGRFLAGLHMDGRARSDATFLAAGTTGAPGYWGSGRPSRWAMLAGWQRAGIRLTVLATLVGLVRWRHITEWVLALVAGPLLGYIGWRVWAAWRMRQHMRDVVIPLYQVLAGYLGTPPDERPEDYLTVPTGWDTDPLAEVVLWYPAGWDPHPGVRDRIEEAITRHLHGQWIARWGKARAVWVKARRPPEYVGLADIRHDFENGPANLVPLGMATGGKVAALDIDADTPHIAYSGGTGAGKTTFLRAVVAFLLWHGAEEVIILDPKRISLLRAFRGLKRVRIIPDSKDWPAAIAYVRAKMQARYEWAETQDDPEAAVSSFPRIGLVIEEGNTLATMLRDDWREVKSPSDPAEPPAIRDLKAIENQGRQGNITVVRVFQQGNAKSFGGSDSRGQYGGKAMVRYDAPTWKMLIGTLPVPRAPKHPGRGYLVIGQEERLVQFVNITTDEARALAIEGIERAEAAPAPDVPDLDPPADAAADLGDVPGTSGEGAEVRPLHAAPRYLTQAEVAELLGMGVAAFTKWRQRCRQSGNALPEPEYFAGRPGWTDDQFEEIAARRRPESATS
jgi:FtsK/SpoIIIE family